mmetsp:Transcript_8011/g.25124  ORF Transcript_8011/g.25124 Transcript_8011/m.25124 type:complete len:212 (-) Transcript_8011:201-836(-)
MTTRGLVMLAVRQGGAGLPSRWTPSPTTSGDTRRRTTASAWLSARMPPTAEPPDPLAVHASHARGRAPDAAVYANPRSSAASSTCRQPLGTRPNRENCLLSAARRRRSARSGSVSCEKRPTRYLLSSWSMPMPTPGEPLAPAPAPAPAPATPWMALLGLKMSPAPPPARAATRASGPPRGDWKSGPAAPPPGVPPLALPPTSSGLAMTNPA